MGKDNIDEEVENTLNFSDMALIDPILRDTKLSDEYPGLKFVLHFAKIDIKIFPQDGKAREKILSGEVPRTLREPFPFKCSNHVNRCPYQNKRKSTVDVHVLTCKYVDEEAGHRSENGKKAKLELPFRCDSEGCNLADKSQHLLTSIKEATEPRQSSIQKHAPNAIPSKSLTTRMQYPIMQEMPSEADVCSSKMSCAWL